MQIEFIHTMVSWPVRWSSWSRGLSLLRSSHQVYIHDLCKCIHTLSIYIDTNFARKHIFRYIKWNDYKENPLQRLEPWNRNQIKVVDVQLLTVDECPRFANASTRRKFVSCHTWWNSTDCNWAANHVNMSNKRAIFAFAIIVNDPFAKFLSRSGWYIY